MPWGRLLGACGGHQGPTQKKGYPDQNFSRLSEQFSGQKDGAGGDFRPWSLVMGGARVEGVIQFTDPLAVGLDCWWPPCPGCGIGGIHGGMWRGLALANQGLARLAGLNVEDALSFASTWSLVAARFLGRMATSNPPSNGLVLNESLYISISYWGTI